VSTREAIRAIPADDPRRLDGGGATRWQTCRYHIVPYAMPGILTGVIIGWRARSAKRPRSSPSAR
jgi:phosphate transport system permease protein